MTFDQLTEDERALAQAFMDAFRPLMGETARLFAKLQRLEDAWAGGVAAIVGKLDADAAIATTTGLAGAQTLTTANLAGTMADFAQALAAFNGDGNRQAYIRAAGLSATL